MEEEQYVFIQVEIGMQIVNDKKDGRNHIEIRERAESNLNEYMDRKEEERTVRA